MQRLYRPLYLPPSPCIPMRTACLLLALLTALLSGCTLSAPSPYPGASSDIGPQVAVPVAIAPPVRRPQPHPVEHPPAFAQAIARGTRTNDGTPGPNYWQQRAQYTLEARLYPEAKRLEGRAHIRYTNNAPEALRVLRLEVAQNMHAEGAVRLEQAEMTGGVRLHRVALDGRTLAADASEPPGYRVEGTQLILRPHQALATGATAEIEVDWSFTIPQAGAGARMGHSQDNFFYLAYWYPQMAVYDDIHGWFTDAFSGQAEFYHGFADYDLTIEAPTGWLVAATGALQNPDAVLTPAVAARRQKAHQSDTPLQIVGPDDFDTATQPGQDGRLRWRFTASTVRDAAFSVTRASTWEAARTPVGDRDGDGQTDYAAINTFYRETAPRWKQTTRYQQHALTFQSNYTGFPYPWPHMTAVEGGGIIGGGMEYPMMTLIGDYNQRGDDALYWVTAHELGHMWIPMIAGTNERWFSWMDEGATTFLENQTRFDFAPGPDHNNPDRQSYLGFARAGLEGEMMRRSDFHYGGDAFGIASYSKPATILVALRGLLGEPVFKRAYRAFIREWAYKHPYPYDLFNTFERVSGQDLDWFWHSWYFETWTLDHAIGGVTQRRGEADILVRDLGNVPMPVRMTVTLDDGTVVNVGLPVEAWLQGRTEMSITVTTPTRVTRVEIDPDMHFPDIDRSNNIWTR